MLWSLRRSNRRQIIGLMPRRGDFKDLRKKVVAQLLGDCKSSNESSSFPMSRPAQKFKILFLCTWNASRSIFAEYFMKEMGSSRFEAFSAGVTPKGQVSPITLRLLQDKFRIDPFGARSKSW